MIERRRLVAILAALIPIAGGCNAILGIESHALAPDGGNGGKDTGSPLPGDAGQDSGFPGATKDADGVDAIPGTTCGFIMPNPPSTGLPNPATYTRTLDGVTDNVTKLIWESKLPEASLFDQGEAVRLCARKGGAWRLPTRIELASLVDFTIAMPGPTINAIFEDRPISKFWTSSNSPSNPKTTGWYVDFEYGITRQATTSLPYRVRCVRGGPSQCPPTRYQFEGDTLVRDGATGLTWQRAVAPTTQEWMAAMKYCPTLGTGWRLPSLTELQTIVDETQESPSIDRVAFPDTPANEYFWTSSPKAGDPDLAWYVIFYHGHADTQPVTNKYFVRCVR